MVASEPASPEVAHPEPTGCACQGAIAELGTKALSHPDLCTLLQEAAEILAQVLGVECSNVLELLPDDGGLLLRAGVGWNDGLVGRAIVGAGRESQAGYTLLWSQPVIVEDLRTEPRFHGPPLFVEHGVVSGMSVAIHGDSRPFGVLGAHTTERRAFTDDEVSFLQAMANVLALAIELRQAKQGFRTLVESAPVGVVMAEGDGRILVVNAMTEEMFGYRREELLGRPVEMLLPERLRGVHARHRAGYFSAPHVRQMGLGVARVGQRKDGAEFPINCGLSFVESQSGLLAISFITDLTALKEAEKVLRESEEEFRLVFENAKDAIFWAEPTTGLITKCNRAAEILLERERDEIVGQHQTAFHPPRKAEFYAGMFRRHLEQHGALDDEAEVIAGSGKIIPVHITASVTSVGGRPVIQGIFRDITEQKQAEAALQKAREELEAKAEQLVKPANPYELTFRESTVLHLIADGKMDKEIAITLGISALTASKHVANILTKMHASSRTEAGVRAVREGLIT